QGSLAQEVGLRAHDILVEVGGKVVPAEVNDLNKIMGTLEAGAPLRVLVLRKGQRVVLQGLRLPQAVHWQDHWLEVADGRFRVQPGGITLAPGAGSVMTSTLRTGDRFNSRYQEGSLIITLSGTIAEGKARVSEVHIQDGAVANQY